MPSESVERVGTKAEPSTDKPKKALCLCASVSSDHKNLWQAFDGVR